MSTISKITPKKIKIKKIGMQSLCKMQNSRTSHKLKNVLSSNPLITAFYNKYNCFDIFIFEID